MPVGFSEHPGSQPATRSKPTQNTGISGTEMEQTLIAGLDWSGGGGVLREVPIDRLDG